MNTLRNHFFIVLVSAVSLCSMQSCGEGRKAEQAERSVPTVLLITDASGENDESFNNAAFNGILSFYEETWNNQMSRGVRYNSKRCAEESQYPSAILAASEEGIWDVIIVMGFSFVESLIEIAPKYPKQKYMIVDADWVNMPNVVHYMFAEHEGSFLVGAAAALKAQEDGVEHPSFGFIGGFPSAVITRFEVGFIQGVHSILPHAEILDFYADSWAAPEAAYAQAKQWYEQGVFAIFCAAGETGIGAIEQAKECRREGQEVWAIGVDIDQYDVGLYAPDTSAVLTSMIKKIESATFATLVSIQSNTFQGNATVTLNLEQNGVGFTDTNRLLSKTIVTRLTSIRNDIINGRISVMATYRDALSTGLVPQGLKAID